MKEYNDVGDFHRKFGLDTSDRGDAGPRAVSEELFQFRRNFMQEELDEFTKAWEEGDPAKQIDALCDLVYVALGTAHMWGFYWPRHWSIVHDANMHKVRAAEGHTGPRGNVEWDVIKPEGWKAPDHNPILAVQGWATAE